MAEPTERQKQNLDVAMRAFAAFNPDELDRVAAFADPDIEVFASPDLANAGSFSGPEGLQTWLQQWLEAWDEYDFEVKAMEPVGDRHVATTIRQFAKGRGSGVPVEMEVTFIADFLEGRMLALHLYPSRAEAHRVAEEREATTRS